MRNTGTKIELITGTVEENMFYALQADECLKTLPSNDPYLHVARKNVEYYLDAAARLERGERQMLARQL
jgi:hypothetical protein